MTTSQAYQSYSMADKQALKELQAYMKGRLGKEVSLADAIAAVEPELTTPAHLTSV